MSEFEAKLENYRALVEDALDKTFPDEPGLNEIMRYSVLGGGKRLRGILALAFREANGGALADAMPLACAVELLHAYSLIHDDLPCMDDDDFRRGKPSAHKKFGEWQALLAGDALQALAFKLAAAEGSEYAATLAEAAYAICVGQYLDLAHSDDLHALTLNKTAALFAAACKLGANTSAANDYGVNLGLTFQLRDDILDKDGYFAAVGEAECVRLMREYTAAAKSAVSDSFLIWLADYLTERTK
ncbi:MAG: polyprenyl synthetase family protein [Oscillospiraceae bacterium]|jgi:geranylgeranyl diphosphate synthase type II|nr:polyprenyl synthetase family protein [Oscillospiraceae bacterium]